MAILGQGSLVIGVLFAIFGGIWGGTAEPTNDLVILVLLISGILVGLLNITHKEVTRVLAATTALLILAIWGYSPAYYPIADLSETLAENVLGVVVSFGLLMAPAAIIIVLKAVISTAGSGD